MVRATGRGGSGSVGQVAGTASRIRAPWVNEWDAGLATALVLARVRSAVTSSHRVSLWASILRGSLIFTKQYLAGEITAAGMVAMASLVFMVVVLWSFLPGLRPWINPSPVLFVAVRRVVPRGSWETWDVRAARAITARPLMTASR